MKKSINIISYKFGYGGHFLQSLLSLDKTTYPILPSFALPDEDFDNIEVRKKYYSFKNVKTNFNDNWCKFHDDYDSTNCTQKFLYSNYKNYTMQGHTYEMHLDKRVYKLCNLKFIQIKLDPNYDYVLWNFFKKNSQYFREEKGPDFSPELKKEYTEQENRFYVENNPYIVKFENFCFGVDLFVEEYEKVCKFVDLPTHLDVAIELYKDWYAARELNKIEDYKNVSRN